MSGIANIPVPRGAPQWVAPLVFNISHAIQSAFLSEEIADTSINDTTIGLTTPAAAAFTTLSITQGAIISGTYTPTLTNSANISSSTALQCQYMRVGSVVTVSGGVTLSPTLIATLTTLGISLPVASTLSVTNKLGGTAASSSVASNVGPIFADTSNNRATLQLISVGTGSETFSFGFSYLVT